MITAEYIKIWPSLESAGQIIIGVEVILKDDAVEVARKSFRTNTEKDGDPVKKAVGLIGEIQSFVDKYKFEKAAYNHVKMDSFITAISNGVNLE